MSALDIYRLRPGEQVRYAIRPIGAVTPQPLLLSVSRLQGVAPADLDLRVGTENAGGEAPGRARVQSSAGYLALARELRALLHARPDWPRGVEFELVALRGEDPAAADEPPQRAQSAD